MALNSIVDRALSEHRGSGLFTKKTNGKYSLFLPIEGTGENGSAPEQLEKTAIGNLTKTYVEGRTDNPQITIPFYAHRDNLEILNAIGNTPQEFLRVLPDFTGFKYTGTVNYKVNNTDVGGLEQGELTITVNDYTGYVADVYSLIEDTALITSSVDEVINLAVAGTKVYNLTSMPADATLSVVSGTVATATASFGSGDDAKKLTITGVANGTSIVKITCSKSGYNSFVRSILVIVP